MVSRKILLRTRPRLFRGYPARSLLLLLSTTVAGLIYFSPGAFTTIGVEWARIAWNVRSVLLGFGEWIGEGILALAGPIPLLILWLSTHNQELVITTDRARKRTGIVSTSTTELELTSIRNVQVEQNLLERILGVGTLRLASAGQAGIELTISGIGDPKGVRDLIYNELS